jgi:hypothetical protein
MWRSIEGYEGHYEVSDRGQVRSIKSSKVLKQATAGRGYPSVTLCKDGVPVTRYVHHLVAAAFIGPRPAGFDTCHNNGDFTDNTAENLRYDTRNANMRDALAHGTHRSRSQTHCVRGHELSFENLSIQTARSSDGAVKTRRVCKECQRASTARYRAKQAA